MKIDGSILYLNFAHVPENIADKVVETPRGYYINTSDIGPFCIIEKRVKTGFSHKIYVAGLINEFAIGENNPLIDGIQYGKDCTYNGINYKYIGKRGPMGSRKKKPYKPENTPENKPDPIPEKPEQKDFFKDSKYIPQDSFKDEKPIPEEKKPAPKHKKSSTDELIEKYYKAKMPLLLWGPTGTGKTFKAVRVAKEDNPLILSLNKETRLSQLSGYWTADGVYIKTPFRVAIDEGRPIIVDEADANAEILLYLNSAISNNVIVFPDQTVTVNSWFCMTANTNGQGAKDGYIRQALDFSTCKRFAMQYVDYDEKIEKAMLPDYAETFHAIRKNIKNHGIRNAMVTTRDFIYASKMLENNFTLMECIDALIVQGNSPEVKETMLRGVTL